MLEIEILPALSDNYIYLAHNPQNGRTFVVDPGKAAPVRRALADHGWSLDAILITHHHHDHIGGLSELLDGHTCPVIGPAAEAAGIPGLTQEVGDGDEIDICGVKARVFSTPGHTLGHVSYWLPDSAALFCGDTLFSLGCGRLFEGTPAQMWNSLERLSRLPGETKVYCGHEYTQGHARFALTIEPDNTDLQRRAKEIDALRAEGHPTVPVALSDELMCNPFLRACTPAVKHALGMSGAEDVEVFAEIRRRKDHFR